MRSQRSSAIPGPPNHAMMKCGFNVTNKPVQLLVTSGRPSRDKTREVANCPEQVKASHPCAVQDFHEDPRRNWLEPASGVRIKGWTIWVDIAPTGRALVAFALVLLVGLLFDVWCWGAHGNVAIVFRSTVGGCFTTIFSYFGTTSRARGRGHMDTRPNRVRRVWHKRMLAPMTCDRAALRGRGPLGRGSLVLRKER